MPGVANRALDCLPSCYRSRRPFLTRFAIFLLLAAGVLRASADAGTPTFNRDIAPILQEHCQSCHRAGEIAPMSLMTYKETRPFAAAIKEAVTLRKMPPWFADPRFGHFENDRRLSQKDIHTHRLGQERRARG